MKKVLILAIAILVLLTLVFLVVDGYQKAQAAANYVWWLPIVYNDYNPHRYGCQLPDGAPCQGGPPFSVIP
jgi:hypothetical protein